MLVLVQWTSIWDFQETNKLIIFLGLTQEPKLLFYKMLIIEYNLLQILNQLIAKYHIIGTKYQMPRPKIQMPWSFGFGLEFNHGILGFVYDNMIFVNTNMFFTYNNILIVYDNIVFVL